MNNTCPSCGAVYNVTSRDVGRKIRCKKCSTKLIVTDAGLEAYQSGSGRVRPAAAAAGAFGDAGVGPDDTPRPTRRGRATIPAFNATEWVARVGGWATVLFGAGVFLVVFTGFQFAIGEAKVQRRQAAVDEGEMEMRAAQKRFDEKKEKTPEDEKNNTQLRETWEKRKRGLEEDREAAAIANKRSVYVDRYILTLGFLLVAFGCLGFLQGTHGVLLRVVAAVILVSMLLALFKAGVGPGVGAGVGASINIG